MRSIGERVCAIAYPVQTDIASVGVAIARHLVELSFLPPKNIIITSEGYFCFNLPFKLTLYQFPKCLLPILFWFPPPLSFSPKRGDDFGRGLFFTGDRGGWGEDFGLRFLFIGGLGG